MDGLGVFSGVLYFGGLGWPSEGRWKSFRWQTRTGRIPKEQTMNRRKKDEVVLSSGEFVVLDDESELDEHELSDELMELARTREEKENLQRHPQKHGKLAAKTWGR